MKYFSDIPYHGLFLILNLGRSKTSGITAQDIVDTVAKQVFAHDVNFIYCFDPKKDKAGVEKVSRVERARII